VRSFGFASAIGGRKSNRLMVGENHMLLTSLKPNRKHKRSAVIRQGAFFHFTTPHRSPIYTS
jgi:hypothetical protein